MKISSLLLTFAVAFSLIFGCMQSIQSSMIEEKTTKIPAGWTDDINLSNNITRDDNPSIATYQNNVYIVWRNMWGGDSRIFYRNSSDGGQTWSDRRQLSTALDGQLPDIAVNNTNLHLVYKDIIGASDYEILYCNSTDGGTTWSSPQMISEDDGFESSGPLMVVNNSNIHVIWSDTRFGLLQSEVYYKRSTDGGITWDDAQGNPNLDRRITHDLSDAAAFGIGINNSNIHVIFGDNRDGSVDVYYTRSTNNGVTWDDGLGTVDEERKLTSNSTDHFSSAIAVNGSTIHVIWTDQVWPNPDYYIYYRNSTDNGATWSPIQLLVKSGTAINPDIIATENEVHVTWNDWRCGAVQEIYYINSTDGGISWNSETRLTTEDGNASAGPKIALSGSQRHIIWQDQRDSNWEVYYKRRPNFPESESPTIQHTPISEANISDEINIIANITDNELIDSVILYYENVGDTTYTAVDMILIDGNTHSGNWTATIPAQTETGLAHYFIWANDTSGNNITSPIMGDYTVQITGPPSIEITNPIGGEDWTGGSNHQIEFIASDTEDATADLDVFLNYTSSVDSGVIATIKGDDSPYDWTLPIINATDVKINATVIDSDGNKSYDDSLEFTIDSSPPKVILTNPVSNTTGISIFQPIVIQFNVKMNFSSVVVDQTSGTDPGGWSWFWNEDKDTVTGIHNAWPRGEIVEITVQVGYKDDSEPGNANNTAYVFSFTTETNPSPEIVHTNISSPQELGDEIRINATITDDGTVMNAVLWLWDVDDNWIESNMEKNGDDWEYIIPGQMKEGRVRYMINATDDLGQKNTTAVYEFYIEDTTSPVITHTSVDSAIIDEPINITCQVTDLGGVNASAVYFVYRYEGDSEFMVEPMNPGFWYEIPAHSAPAIIEYYLHAFDIYGNDASTQLHSLEIIDSSVPDTTPPEVLLATPTGDDIPISTDISIVFSEAVNQTSVENAISVSPDISFSSSWTNNQTIVLSITGNLSYNTTYTVTIDNGAKDPAGNTLANDYSWQFTTAEEPEIIEPPVSDDWGWIVIIIILSVIIALLLFYQFRERKDKETEDSAENL